MTAVSARDISLARSATCEHLVRGQPGQQILGNLAGRGQQPLAPLPLVVEPRILDRDTRGCSERLTTASSSTSNSAPPSSQ